MTEITIYEIPAQNLAGLLFKIEKVSKKAKKIIGKPINLQVLSENRVPRVKTLGSGQKIPATDALGNQYIDVTYTVSVQTEPVKINGWTFIARIDHSADSGNILRVSPNVTCDIPEKYRTVGALCDHCNKIRPRRDTFLLRNDETGQLKQIGRQCVRDFIGYDVEHFLSMAECISSVVPSDDDGDFDGYNGMSDRRYIRVPTYLANVSACIRHFGWCSRKDAEFQGKMPTSSAAHENMFRKNDRHFQRKELLAQDFETADAALAWAQKMPVRNDFDHNMKVIASEIMVEGRSTGILAYIIPAYLKHMEQEFARTARKAALALTDSRHVGAVGDKLVGVKAVLYGYNTTEGQYGTVTIYKFRTDDGNVLTWFSSQGVEGLGSMAAVNRQAVILKGTVKGHSEFEGVKQTTITRCKVEILESVN